MFNEKTEEYSNKSKSKLPVVQSSKYQEAKKKALELIDGKKFDLAEGDFWILMNETKNGQMMYTGLIISHNGCLKINDKIEEKLKFKPSCMTLDKEGYRNSLVYTYINDEQGIYEVGEVSVDNCKNAYPYAMALKRCMDRVILKNCKLAYSGVYSDSEADEFAGKNDDDGAKVDKKIDEVQLKALEGVLEDYCSKTEGADLKSLKANLLNKYGLRKFEDVTESVYVEILKGIQNSLKK